MKIFFGKLTYHPDFVINYKVLRDKVAIEENIVSMSYKLRVFALITLS